MISSSDYKKGEARGEEKGKVGVFKKSREACWEVGGGGYLYVRFL